MARLMSVDEGWVTPREIGEAIAYLASDAARSITGPTLVIDGGTQSQERVTIPTGTSSRSGEQREERFGQTRLPSRRQHVSRLRNPLAFLFTVVALTGLAAAVVAQTASARTQYALDPDSNIPAPATAYGPMCSEHPFSSRCERVLIRALNHARAVMGQPSYRLPTRFKALTGTDQLLVLSNQDRRLYGRAPITGFNATLNASAQRGATHGSDPAFVPLDSTPPAVGAANWSGGLPSPLLAYYNWMYADGVSNGSSGNVDCRQPGDSACWGHRHATLMRGGSHNKVVMGGGHGKGPSGMVAWTELYEAFWPSVPIDYVPSVTGLSSYSGSCLGGAEVKVTGFGFVHVTGVTVGDKPAKFTVLSPTVLWIVTPTATTGRTHVRVTTRGGESNSTAAAAYTYI
jgi:hypothetical protein